MGVNLMLMPLQAGVDKVSSARVPAPPVGPKVRFVRPSRPLGAVAPTDEELARAFAGPIPTATQLQYGFWDNAFRLFPPPPGEKVWVKTLLNEEPEHLNFVGGDTRRFYIAVEDKAAAGRGFVEVTWWTAKKPSAAREVIEDPPQGITTLIETRAGSGVFISKGLMLVNDRVDAELDIHSGVSESDPKLGKHGGLRDPSMSNYRTRSAGMFSFGVAQYRSRAPGAPATPVTVFAPVFADSSRRIEVQVYVLRNKRGGLPSVPLAEIASRDLRIVTETYERHGIWLVTKASSADLAVAGTRMHQIGSPIEYTILEVDPPAKVNDASLTDENIDDVSATFMAPANTLRLFFVKDLLIWRHPLGVSFDGSPVLFDPDDHPMAVVRQPAVSTTGCSFVRVARDPYTAAHELGHLLMAKLGEGHFHTDNRTQSARSSTGERRVEDCNLMVAGSKGQGENYDQTKRLWDGIDDQGYPQLAALHASPYVR